MTRASKATPLYQLQQLDLELERATFAAQAISKALQDDVSLRTAMETLETARHLLKQHQQALRTAEQELESLETRIKGHSDRLYSGKLANPRELESLQHEVQHLRELHSVQEDRVLETMAAAEEAQTLVNISTEKRAAAASAYQQEQTELLERQRQVEAHLAELHQRRQEQAERCDAPLLQRYEQIRKTRGGKAVALAEGGTCQWCRVSLTASDAQRLRTSEDVIMCSNCGRILYLP